MSRVTSSEEFQVVLREVQRSGGYVEVSAADSRYPRLSLSVSGDFGIVHSFLDEDDCRLLLGDGSVPASDVMEFSIIDEDAVFSGGFISSRTRACDVLNDFVEGMAPVRTPLPGRPFVESAFPSGDPVCYRAEIRS